MNEEGVHSLLIDPASFPDSGTYSCFARNKVGEASFSVELKVVGMYNFDMVFWLFWLKFSYFWVKSRLN